MPTVKLTELDALTEVSESDALLFQDISDTTATAQGTAKKLTVSDIVLARYADSSVNFTGTLQQGGSNVLVDTDIGSTVQAYDASLSGMVSAFTLPTTDGSENQALITDGAGALSFANMTETLTGVTASNSITEGQPLVINTDGTVSRVAESGALSVVGAASEFDDAGYLYCRSCYNTTGDKIIVVYSGTGLDAYACVGTVSGSTITWGTPTTFDTGVTKYMDVCYDSGSDKVIAVYADQDSSDYGYCRVGTVSGTSISFGSRVQVCTNTYFMACAYDSTNNKVVVLYRDDIAAAFNPECVVGTVSGSSISFGTPVNVDAGVGNYLDIVYASADSKVVVTWTSGSTGYGIVGTVSGTSISFGTKVSFDTGVGYPQSGYDPTSQQVIIAYTDSGNSNYPTVCLGAISGTAISFGTPVAYGTEAGTDALSVDYDANTSRILAIYEGSVSGDLYASIGTVSGTTASFTTPIQVTDGLNVQACAVSYDPDQTTMVITATGSATEAHTFTIDTSPDNLTSENFIGFAAADYADSESVEVQIRGTLTEAQTGLTAGQAYYVQLNGTLDTTPDSPSVYAGVAISSTALSVKG